MAKGKPTPDRSRIQRERPLAYARRQKGSGGLGGPAASGEPDKDDDKDDDDKEGAAAEPAKPAAEDASAEAKPESPTDASAEPPAGESPAIEPPPAKGEPWPDATPQPMRPVEPARAGAPPEVLAATPGSVEDPTFMPGPREVPGGNPNDPAPPPGLVPSGDSRSLRKDNEFALVYRVGTAVVSRSGAVGTRGQWRVVDYPTSSSASSAFAKEVSRFVAEGFSDYRD